MLVLSRIAGEAIVIGNEFEVTIARIMLRDVGLVVRNIADGSEKSAMLQIGDNMLLGEQVRVTVVDVQVTDSIKKMRLGIEVPRGIGVWRKEQRP